MTSGNFERWLRGVNNRMLKERRKILLFLDNCPVHPPMELSNMKLVFLPPNTTSRLQPLDAGIIKAFKMHYRRNLLSYITLRWDQPNSEPGFSKVSSPFRISTDYVQISLLDALVWIKEAWKEVSIAIISKCFRTCGIGPLTSSSSPKAYSHFCMRSNRPRWMVGRRYAGGLCYNWYVASSLSNLFVDESIDVFEDSFFGRGEYYKMFNSEKRYRIRRSHDHVGWALSQADMLRKFRSANGLVFAPIYPGDNEKTTEYQGSVMRTNKQYLMIILSK